MHKGIIKLLLKNEWFLKNRQYITRDLFPSPVDVIFDTITDAHGEYNRDLSVEEVRQLLVANNPAITRANALSIHTLLDEVYHTEPVGTDVAQDILKSTYRSHIGKKIAEQGIRLMHGESTDISPIESILEQSKGNFTSTDNFTPISQDIDDILAAVDQRKAWSFNIPALAEKVPGISAGDFTIIFARPESGKTAFVLSICSSPNGFCWQGAKVLYIVNEEPAVRTMLRIITAATGMTKDEVLLDRPRARELFKAVGPNIQVIDNVDMGMAELDAYVEKTKPDILIVDQLDKVHIDGTYARADESLTEVYRRAREIGKRRSCAVIGVSQASADAEGKTFVHYSMLAGSKTGKAGEADLIIGIGKFAQDNSEEESCTRTLTLSKNKITGDHGSVNCIINKQLSRYEA